MTQSDFFGGEEVSSVRTRDVYDVEDNNVRNMTIFGALFIVALPVYFLFGTTFAALYASVVFAVGFLFLFSSVSIAFPIIITVVGLLAVIPSDYDLGIPHWSLYTIVAILILSSWAGYKRLSI